MKKRIAILIGIICTFLFVCSSCHKDSVFVDSIKDLELQILDEYEDDVYISNIVDTDAVFNMQITFYSLDKELDIPIASKILDIIRSYIVNHNEYHNKTLVIYFEIDTKPNHEDPIICYVTNNISPEYRYDNYLSYLHMEYAGDYYIALECFNGIDTIDCREVSLNSTSNILANSDSIHYVYVDESIYESISELYPDIVFCY